MTTPSRDEAQTSDESVDDWRNDPSQHPSKSENQQEICHSKNVFRNDVCADNVRNSIDGCYLRAGILMVELDSSFDNEDMCIYKYALDTFPTFTK